MDILEQLKAKLKTKNIDEFEIIKKNTKKRVIKAEKGKIKDFKNSVEENYTLRIIKNNKIGFTYFTNKQTDYDNIIEKAVALSQVNFPDKLNSFYNNDFNIVNKLNLYDEKIKQLSENEQFETACKIEDTSYKLNKKIINVKDAATFKGEVSVTYINSHNIEKFYSENYCGGTVTTVAKDNHGSMVGYEYFISKDADIDYNFIAKSSVNKAVRMLNPQKGGSMDCPVIIENELFADILTIIAPSFFAENIDKKKSLFSKNNRGDIVASSNITLIDDATNNNFIGAAAFDDEGTPTCRKILINSGKINDYLFNYYYSKKYNTKYAGNAFIPGFKNSPAITYTNLILEKKDNNLSDTIKTLKKSLLLTNLMGLHLADPISGDFSLGGEGILIEQGELTKPVKEFILAGNIKNILKNCIQVFNDVKVNGNVISPSIMVEGLIISGN